MTPTAFKIAQLDETKRSNLENENIARKGNVLNFISKIIGSGLSVVGSGVGGTMKGVGSALGKGIK